jgi:AcrR family transcriptional regulator
VAGRSLSREEVAEAAWRVIVRDGLHRTSVRAIAKQLGATTGVVTYYFRTKTELLLFALDRLTTAIDRAVEASLVGANGVERVRRILATTLPQGPKEITGWRIWVAFLGQAIGSRKLREEHQRRVELLSLRLTRELLALREAGRMHAQLDPRREADALIALADGIGVGFLVRPRSYPARRQLAIVDGYLRDRLGLAIEPAPGPVG